MWEAYKIYFKNLWEVMVCIVHSKLPIIIMTWDFKDTTKKPEDKFIEVDTNAKWIYEEAKQWIRCPIPVWFYDVMHEYDWLCEV